MIDLSKLGVNRFFFPCQGVADRYDAGRFWHQYHKPIQDMKYYNRIIIGETFFKDHFRDNKTTYDKALQIN